MSRCTTRKICHDSEERALNALIENRIRFHHPHGSGPINVYQCTECGYYHFTSKGNTHPELLEQADYIATQRRARDWEQKLR